MQKRTKIGATIGPACSDENTLLKMVEAGMDFARLNFSHGTHEEHAKLITALRKVEQKTGKPIAIMQDLQGPKIRLGTLPEEGIVLAENETVFFDTAGAEYTASRIPVTFPGLEKHVAVGQHILIDDGRIEAIITALHGSTIEAKVLQGGIVASHKGLNFPDSTLAAIPALSEKDILDVAFGVSMGVDCISLSFVKTAADIEQLRHVIAQAKNDQSIDPKISITVIAKIERPEAVNNLDEIIKVADGVMVARGDLGLEMPGAMLAVTQKNIVRTARLAGKPVMIATQLLDSMQHSRRPTRAEYTDVANSVIDHADALLLTNETAVGDFPVETVATMTDIIVATEQSSYDDIVISPKKTATLDPVLARLLQLVTSTERIRAISIGQAALSLVGSISKLRIEIPVLAAVPTIFIARSLVWYWGVTPIVTGQKTDAAELEVLLAKMIGITGEEKAAVAIVSSAQEAPYTITVQA